MNLRQLREKYNLDDTSTGVVTKDDIEDVVARWTGVPMTAIREEEWSPSLLRIEDELHHRVISQEKAISAGWPRAIRRSRAGAGIAQASGRIVFVPGSHRRGKDRGRARAGRVPCSAARNR